MTKPNSIGDKLALVILAVLLAGCHVNRDFGPPGDMNSQRSRAMRHDPYPSSDLGPEIHGSRPRGFDLPRNEIQKLQSSPNARRGSQVPYGGY
jgi:hypothetical protein